jgi:AcrR family transcriptional regulator
VEIDEQLLAGAQVVLGRYGLAGATMERIAAEAGTSRMTLHRRGISKAEILRRLAERLEAEYREAMWPALVVDDSARERLVLALHGECEVAENNLALLDALTAAERAGVFHEHSGAGLTRPVFVEALRRILRDGVQEGSLATDDVDESATVLFNLVGHTYRHLRSGHGWDPQRARAAVIRVAVDGIAAR